MSGLLVDTNVLVDHLRGVPQAGEYLQAVTEDISVSSVTVAELHAGVRDEEERASLRTFVSSFRVIPADGAICEMGGVFRSRYGASHGLDLIDAIIAATSVARQIALVTLNKRHFPMLKQIIVPYVHR